MFGISVLVLIADRVSTASSQKPKKTKSNNSRVQKRNKVPKERMNKVLNNTASSNVSSSQAGDFQPISAEVLSLEGWGRNPFEKRETLTPTQSDGMNGKKNRPSTRRLNLDNLSIDGVYKIGNDAVVIIDGKKFEEGQKLNDMIIEKIESRKITFRQGKKSYVVNVGS